MLVVGAVTDYCINWRYKLNTSQPWFNGLRKQFTGWASVREGGSIWLMITLGLFVIERQGTSCRTALSVWCHPPSVWHTQNLIKQTSFLWLTVTTICFKPFNYIFFIIIRVRSINFLHSRTHAHIHTERKTIKYLVL